MNIKIPPCPGKLPIEKPDIERWLLGLYGVRPVVERDGDGWVCSWPDPEPGGFVEIPWGSLHTAEVK
ncbi:MAG: hypothetical protein F6K00_19775 [Leptolyngbya sp. SIOISBB]|nr:hypothetical protein [Leptolyngbya sp. SIOISBB]